MPRCTAIGNCEGVSLVIIYKRLWLRRSRSLVAIKGCHFRWHVLLERCHIGFYRIYKIDFNLSVDDVGKGFFIFWCVKYGSCVSKRESLGYHIWFGGTHTVTLLSRILRLSSLHNIFLREYSYENYLSLEEERFFFGQALILFGICFWAILLIITALFWNHVWKILLVNELH